MALMRAPWLDPDLIEDLKPVTLGRLEGLSTGIPQPFGKSEEAVPRKRHKRRSNSQDLQRNNNRTNIRQHIKRLGLQSEKEYRKWCSTRGLGDGVYKSDRQIRKEQALATRQQGEHILAFKRSQTRNPKSTISNLYEHSSKKGRLGADYLYKIRRQFNTFAKGPARQALHQLFLRSQAEADLFGLYPAVGKLGEIAGNTYIEGMAALARRQEEWIRPVDTWSPSSHNPRRQFSSLVRHLLAQYEVPVFMDAAWLMGNSTDAVLRQNWFIHVGAGGNIRTADIPVAFTKKMAHEFLDAPNDLPVDNALRWGQVLGQGGSETLARAIIRSRLGSSFEAEEFWSTVILFFARNPMLDPSQVGPITDFIHNQKFVDRNVVGPGGVWERLPPAQPSFSMKSRSIPKLMRQMEEWHEELANQVHPDEPPVEQSRSKKRWHKLLQWERSAVGEFGHEEFDATNRKKYLWTVRELLSNRELVEEGRHMHHCVASYVKSCRGGSKSIWSVSVRQGGGKREPVLTIALDPQSRLVSEVRGRFNLETNAKKARGKQAVENRYLRLLVRSRAVLQRWMQQERLTAS